jgi:threonine synthase
MVSHRPYYSLACKSCGAKYDAAADSILGCEKCGGLLGVDYDVSSVSLSRNNLDPNKRMWQFSELLPLAPGEEPLTLGEGGTPLVLGAKPQSSAKLAFKVDYVNPTGSFKDRGAALLLTKARSEGAKAVVIDSSGNAAAAVSAYSASASIDCHVFVPATTSPDKLRQILAYGARLTKVEGTREDVLKAAKAAAAQSGSYYCGFQFNPFAAEASKTVAYEIAQQRGWDAPDYVILPMGTGGLAIGCAKGFSDLVKLGWISQQPKIIGAQAEGCAPLVRALRDGGSKMVPVEHPHTVAEGLKIGNPYRWPFVVEEIARTGGTAVAVSEPEIRHACEVLAKAEGLYAEPSGAVSFAAYQKLSGENAFSRDDEVVCVLTGSGLKSSSALTPS